MSGVVQSVGCDKWAHDAGQTGQRDDRTGLSSTKIAAFVVTQPPTLDENILKTSNIADPRTL